MALGSNTQWNLCVNHPANPIKKQDELAGQGPIKRFNVGSDETLTKASTPPETLTPPLVFLFTKDLFIKFIKIFMKMIQAQAQALAKPWEQFFKARTPKMYWGKSYIKYYHFCQQCENYFETSSTTRMNHIPFATPFLYSFISIRWAQYKRRYKNATLITWFDFKTFLWKDLRSSQAFINSI